MSPDLPIVMCRQPELRTSHGRHLVSLLMISEALGAPKERTYVADKDVFDA